MARYLDGERPDENFIAISAGYNYSLGLQEDGKVIGWGDNFYGQINCPDETFVAIAAGYHHSLGLRADGKVFGWGFNIVCPDIKFALPYDFLERLNRNFKALCPIPKYIKMEIFEDYTGWIFGNLYHL